MMNTYIYCISPVHFHWFRTGSDHIREKDGIWAALAWLSVMEHTSKSIEDILKQHWTAYGRNYFTRYDYEDCDLEPCNDMIATLEKSIANPEFVGKEYTSGGKTYKVKVADNFSYTDPVDKSVSTKQASSALQRAGWQLNWEELMNATTV